MPPGYQNRHAEIDRLSRELQEMGRFGRLLWDNGSGLEEAVHGVFGALKFQTEALGGPDSPSIAVRIDGRRRLLVHLSSGSGVIQKKSADVARIFQMLHEVADENDRVLLVANTHPDLPPASRPESLAPEALNLLRRLGANFLGTPALFALWTLALQEPDRARAHLERVHAQDGGVFVLTASR